MLSSKKRRIHYLSALHKGSHHDFTMLQDCFPPGEHWFKNFIVHLDLGFQGFVDRYCCLKANIPFKKKRAAKGQSNELTDEQKVGNKQNAGERIAVEHSIGGMKRYRILSNRIRLKSTVLIDTIIGVCVSPKARWNFMLT